jgi:hypothetical protein
MSTSTALRPAVRAAFASLVDYAGLFPPVQLPLAEAEAEYVDARGGPHAWMLGRFVIPAASLAALPEPFDAPLSVIVEPDVDALNLVARLRARGVKVDALEIPLRTSVAPFRKHFSFDEMLNVLGALEADLVVSGLRDLPTFAEIPRTEPWLNLLPETLHELARLGIGAKIRCGGVTAEAFPSVDDAAGFIAGAARAGAAFKATAGLHHPIRHRDRATGFMMHGFLNILAGAALAARADAQALRAIVAEEDPSAFAFDDDSFSWRDQRIGLTELRRTRSEIFVGYGSCSFSEPVQDLTALGILATR